MRALGPLQAYSVSQDSPRLIGHAEGVWVVFIYVVIVGLLPHVLRHSSLCVALKVVAALTHVPVLARPLSTRWNGP